MSLSWTVPELLQYKQEGFRFHEKVVLPLELFHSDPEIRRISPLDVKGVTVFSKRSLTFHLEVEGKMVLPCAVTLVDVVYPFHIRTSESYKHEVGNNQSVDEAEGSFVHPVTDNRIDLIPALVEAILVEKPMRIVSDAAKDDPNLEGDGWTLLSEETLKQRVDPRLEKLKHFFDE